MKNSPSCAALAVKPLRVNAASGLWTTSRITQEKKAWLTGEPLASKKRLCGTKTPESPHDDRYLVSISLPCRVADSRYTASRGRISTTLPPASKLSLSKLRMVADSSPATARHGLAAVASSRLLGRRMVGRSGVGPGVWVGVGMASML